MKHCILLVLGVTLSVVTPPLHAEVKVVSDRNDAADAAPQFKFRSVPSPARNDAATKATFTIVDGRRDPNGGDLPVLSDGKVPTDEDAPAANFFFRAGTAGGRLAADLGTNVAIQQINSYSWHANTRAPQVYTLYASDGKAADFNREPKTGTNPESCGWKRVAKVDTRPESGPEGGQYGVSISDSGGSLGNYRFLLFDISRTEERDAFGNTFFSEIDVVDSHGPAPEPVDTPAASGQQLAVEAEGGKYKITIDISDAGDLADWVRTEIVPMVKEWYPKMVKMLPSEGFVAPAKFSIVFDPKMQGVAATGGTRIRCSAGWMRNNLKGEAVGAVFHEMVHVVQQYGRTPRAPGASRAPGWLTEGITDYLRWYQYEPQSRGAEITKRNLARARYDGSYRITANFLNWVSQQHGQDFVVKLNAAIREGRYSEEVWKNLTSHTVQELGSAWRAELEKKLGAEATAPVSSEGKSQ